MLRLTWLRATMIGRRRSATGAGILADNYGVSVPDAEWVQCGLEEPGRFPLEPAERPGVTVGFAPAERSLAPTLIQLAGKCASTIFFCVPRFPVMFSTS
jgi:hypothetical protein